MHYDQRYIVPVFLNGQPVMSLRDTGNFAHTLVDRNLVGKHQILEGKFARMKGPFDRDYIQCPLAQLALTVVWL